MPNNLTRASRVNWNRIVIICAALGALLGALNLARIIQTGFSAPPEWDFLCFYLYSAAARAGLNIYTPGGLSSVPLPVPPTPEFVEEILHVGSPYPPPAMFLFYPLSWFSYGNGYLLWMAAQSAFLITALILLRKETERRLPFSVIAALVILWPSTELTFRLAQTNFIVLTALLFSRRSSTEFFSGIWIALGAFVKPLAVLLLLSPLVKKKWKVLAGAFVGAAVAFSAAAGFFGTGMLEAFVSGGSGRRPNFVFTERINQSLLGTVLRLSDFDFQSGSPFFSPWFLAGAFAIFAVTSWLLSRCDPSRRDDGFCLNLLCALILYPGTLAHYGVYLVLPLFILMKQKNKHLETAALVLVTAALCGVHDGALMFVGMLGLWLLFAARIALGTMNGDVPLVFEKTDSAAGGA